jgi:hypothetical protein
LLEEAHQLKEKNVFFFSTFLKNFDCYFKTLSPEYLVT